MAVPFGNPLTRHEPATTNTATFVGQGGNAHGNRVFPHYSDNDDDDYDRDNIGHLRGESLIHDPYEKYGDGLACKYPGQYYDEEASQ